MAQDEASTGSSPSAIKWLDDQTRDLKSKTSELTSSLGQAFHKIGRVFAPGDAPKLNPEHVDKPPDEKDDSPNQESTEKIVTTQPSRASSNKKNPQVYSSGQRQVVSLKDLDDELANAQRTNVTPDIASRKVDAGGWCCCSGGGPASTSEQQRALHSGNWARPALQAGSATGKSFQRYAKQISCYFLGTGYCNLLLKQHTALPLSLNEYTH